MFQLRILILALASLFLSGCSFTLSPLLILMLVETPVQVEECDNVAPLMQLEKDGFESEMLAKR